MRHKKLMVVGMGYLIVVGGLSLAVGLISRLADWQAIIARDKQNLQITQENLATTAAALAEYLAADQYQINQQLKAEIAAIEAVYHQSVDVYEDLLDLRSKTSKIEPLEQMYAAIVNLLSVRNYATAAAQLKDLSAKIKTEEDKLAVVPIPANVPVSNTPPTGGYNRQQVQLDIGTYMVSLVAADLNSTRVVVDTASEGTCVNDCPVMALGDYVARSGAFAGVNGPYFCPATYPNCAGKTNSFDTLIMNKNKVYLNSDNNVYSNVPAVIFSGNSARFIGNTSEWGRSTDVDSVIAAQPFLVSNGQVVFGGDGDPKKGSKGPRGFIGVSGSTVYIGHVHNATVAESARVLHTMGIQNALNLDGGGSVALWSGGYKVGPGRALPMGILLVKK